MRNILVLFVLCLLIGCGAVAACTHAESKLERFEVVQRHMGVGFGFVFYAEGAEQAETASAAVARRIGRIESIMSDYDVESEISRLTRRPAGEPVKISRELCDVLKHAQDLSLRSNGAFDVTVGPYTRLWRRAKRLQQLPSPARLMEAREVVGFEKLKLDSPHRMVTLAVEGMRLDLGGIAKGYAADEALRTFAEHGICRALVDASGDIALGDPPPGKPGWTIGIAPLKADAPPSRQLVLSRCAIATSGDAFQFTEIDGKRYSHIIDPRTGIGLTQRSSVTTLAPTCMTADALASAISVLGPAKGLQLTEVVPGAAALVVTLENGQPKLHVSKRFPENDDTDPRSPPE